MRVMVLTVMLTMVQGKSGAEGGSDRGRGVTARGGGRERGRERRSEPLDGSQRRSHTTFLGVIDQEPRSLRVLVVVVVFSISNLNQWIELPQAQLPSTLVSLEFERGARCFALRVSSGPGSGLVSVQALDRTRQIECRQPCSALDSTGLAIAPTQLELGTGRAKTLINVHLADRGRRAKANDAMIATRESNDRHGDFVAFNTS